MAAEIDSKAAMDSKANVTSAADLDTRPRIADKDTRENPSGKPDETPTVRHLDWLVDELLSPPLEKRKMLRTRPTSGSNWVKHLTNHLTAMEMNEWYACKDHGLLALEESQDQLLECALEDITEQYGYDWDRLRYDPRIASRDRQTGEPLIGR